MWILLPCYGITAIFAPYIDYNCDKMKRIIRTVWIGALSGLAFLTACCTSRGLTRQERKQLVRERDSIQEILKMREMAAVYGTPEIMANYKAESYRLQYELDSINNRLNGNVDVDKSKMRYTLQQRIAQLQAALQQREGACVYGTPEIIQQYGEETRRMKNELEDLRQQLKELK